MFAFDRASGAAVGSIATPNDIFGNPSPSAIAAADSFLALLIPGCCGSGVELYDPVTLTHRMTIHRPAANTVAWSGRYLVIGGEDGAVDLWDVDGAGPVLLNRVNLRTLTGHTGGEDIEIRALWVDNRDRLIFAGSSWGNDQSRGPDLPSFFVLERTGD